jgi:AraC-like DNA-binding protein
MAAPAPYPDEELHQTLSALARRRLLQKPQQIPYATRVYQTLIWQKPPRDTKMSTVARALGLSVRTLRRHLTAEAKSYSDIVNEALIAIAKTSLRDERRTIIETALDLGFADNTSFHRAFKRWTGLTPMEYQRESAAAI